MDSIRVQLKDGHPHAGEYGSIAVVDDKVTLVAPLGIGAADMVRVELESCVHGSDACYAKQSQMRLVRSSPPAQAET